jgi:hypothetical protein
LFRQSPLTRFGLLVAMVAALSFAVAACGDDDSTSSDSTSAEDVKPVAEIPNLTGEVTEVTFDSGFVQALTDLEVTPGPVGDAEISKDGVASFPITGGNVTYYDPASPVRPFVQGIIDHEGSGLSLEAGGTTVELTDFVIDPGTSELTGTVTANGKEAATDALLFTLDGSTLNPLKSNPDGSATLEGTTVKLSDDAAALLNETFGIDALEEGLVIGTSSITVAG